MATICAQGYQLCSFLMHITFKSVHGALIYWLLCAFLIQLLSALSRVLLSEGFIKEAMQFIATSFNIIIIIINILNTPT